MEEVIYENDFSASLVGLNWENEPKVCQLQAENGKGLLLHMDEKTDYWQKTYYNPVLMADNGHFLARPSPQKCMVETEFQLEAGAQFDQAGLMVRVSKQHWIKAGFEYVDGACQLSCVVTNDCSDWSTQEWGHGNCLGLRVYRQGQDYVLEARNPTTGNWSFYRICRLHHNPEAEVNIGLFACSPVARGGKVHFKYLNFKKTEGHSHTNAV